MIGVDPRAAAFAQRWLPDPRYAEAKRSAIASYLSLYTTPSGWELHYDGGCVDTRRHGDNLTPATPEQREALAFCLNCHNGRRR